MFRPAGARRTVFEEIDALCVDGYASFAGGLTGPGDPRPAVTADALLDTAMRGAIDARFTARFDGFDAFDRRAVHSIWMKWYLNRFLPPVLMADVLLQRSLPLALADVRFIIADDARVGAVRLEEATTDSAGMDPFDRLAPLIFDHFQPLIALWTARTDVTARVFWSNVGNTFEAMLRRIEQVSGRSRRLAEAQRLIDEPLWGDAPNPLFDAVHYIDAQPERLRRRRICCLQYLLPDRRFCKACPVEEAHMPADNGAAAGAGACR